jgi:PAS domain S-box-containing protein
MWRADAVPQGHSRRRIDFQWRLDSKRLRLLLSFLFFGLAFLIAYKYAMDLSPRTGAPFWLPDSVLLCALLTSQPRYWLVYIAATLPLRLVVAVPPSTPVWFLLAAFANDSLKAVLAATLLRRFLPGRGMRFDRLRDFWIYLAAAVAVAPALSGVAGAASWVALSREFWPAWRNWYFGDALANLVLTPLLLCLALDCRKLMRAKPVRYLEGFAVFLGLFLAVQLNKPSILDLHDYIPVAILLVAAVRFGPAGACASLTMMSMLWVAASSASQPFASAPDETTGVLNIQLFLIFIGIPTMSLSVLLEQQRRTEHSLRESEARFRIMADTAPVMIWISGPDKLAMFFNKGWLDFTGNSIDQELGYGWAFRIHPDHRSACLSSYTSAFDSRRVWQTECQLRRADGEYRWVLCHGAPRFAEDGAFDGYIVSGSDITELKSAQEASLARQKLESLGVLAGGIAHDFNNLLGGILANAEIAEASAADGSFPDAEIQNIKATSMRASGIVRQLMIYAGNEGANAALLDLSRLVEEMLDLIKISVSKSAVLKTNLRRDLPLVLGAEPQIQQVVMNLILNASDALSGRDGVITVTTSLKRAGGSPIFNWRTSLREGDYVVLEVSDTGSGISTEEQAKIFDPFFTTKVAGRGLGLAVVQGVVRAHKGSIELTSALGQGTTFRVLWPVVEQEQDRIPSAGSANIPLPDTSSSGTVLVVEDERVLRIAVAQMLRKEGLTVIEVDNGADAVDLFRDHQKEIDVVLLDMTIPGTPSGTVVREVGRLRPEAKILLTSAYNKEMVGSLADAEQVKGFIRKPFQLGELVNLIRKTLST